MKNILDLPSNTNCIWLIGKSINVDIIWNYYDWPIIDNIQNIINYDLFQTTNYKYTLKKEDYKFFKTNNHAQWQSQVIIKNIDKIDKDIVHKDDITLNIDEIEIYKLITCFINKYKIEFHKEELNFILLNITNLQELTICILLKECEIKLSEWNQFFKVIQNNWYKKLKENTLFAEGILQDSIIPIMQYVLNSPYTKNIIKNKGAIQFLATKIKSGSKVWEFNKIWKSII